MKRARPNSKLRKAFQGTSRGMTLIEVLIALALMGIIAISYFTALSTAAAALIIADQRVTAESLARSQLEYVKNQDYIDYSESGHATYDSVCNVLPDGCPQGFQVAIVVEPINPETYEPYDEKENEEGVFEDDRGIQKITVIVSRDDEPIIAVEGFKSIALA